MKNTIRRGLLAAALVVPAALGGHAFAGAPTDSVARQWNDELLDAIRNDLARPTVHARNLWHLSIAMWDAWAAYDTTGLADSYFYHEDATAADIELAREQAITYASYRILVHRFQNSVGAGTTIPALNAKMIALTNDWPGFDINYTDLNPVPDTAPALGNRIADAIITGFANDGANESNDYANLVYLESNGLPVNEPLLPEFPGNPTITDPNRWQPLALEFFIDQNGNPFPFGYPDFLSPEWGAVPGFALKDEDKTTYQRNGFDWDVFHDPGLPPQLGGVGDAEYRSGFELVLLRSSLLDPTDGVNIDISPASIGGSTLGTNDGTGRAMNPVTGMPYTPQIVKAADYYRILAEFWADGPDSEAPPGHWNVILNEVKDHPLHTNQLEGAGPVLGDLEWDVKTYFAMNAGMHDAAIVAWGCKGWYDYIRPVSALRYMADQGQSSDPGGLSYDPDGITLYPGKIEVITPTTIGTYHAHLAEGDLDPVDGVDDAIGKIAAFAWRGPDFITDPETDIAGCGWILVANWWPYQRPSFVTPPFAGYVSGHSTYSRAAAEIMTRLTGTEYFPGGVGEFPCPQNEFLVFEEGPTTNVTLEWATYSDASDECSLSRIYGGIHPPHDDFPGRIMGYETGIDAYLLARKYFTGQVSCPNDVNGDRIVSFLDLVELLSAWGPQTESIIDFDEDGIVGFLDLVNLLSSWGDCP